MFKIICDIMLEVGQFPHMNQTNDYAVNTPSNIRYYGCKPCKLPDFLLTKNSEVSDSNTVNSVIELSNLSGLTPSNDVYSDAYKAIINSGDLSQYKFVAFVEENRNVISYINDITPKISVVYERIESSKSGLICGTIGLIQFDKEPIYKEGVLQKLDTNNGYLVDKYLLKYLEGNNLMECKSLDAPSSFVKFINSISFYDFTGSVNWLADIARDEILEQMEYDKYKSWLKDYFKQIFSESLEKFTICKVGSSYISMVGDEPKNRQELCESLDGTYSTNQETAEMICQNTSGNIAFIEGNSLYNVTCDNYQDFL